MRHRSKKTILGRTKAPREAMLRNLATSFVLYEKIKTTKTKAKVLRSRVERLITVGRANNLASRRRLAQELYHPNAVRKVLEVLSPRYKERPGGYTRIIPLGKRKGDNAEVVQIEFV